MSWWNPWSWSSDVLDRWRLGYYGFFRWIMVLLMCASAVGFLVWFGVTAVNERALSRHGAVVIARVEDAVPEGDDVRCLLSYVVDGQSEARWSSDVGELKVDDTVSLIVDRTDHSNFMSTAAYGRRWVGYVIQVLASAVFGALGIVFIRMDAAGFRWYARASGGHFD